jgi:PEP-CTERM motif
MSKAVTRGAVFVIALSLVVGAAYAAPITGELDITGDVAVGATTIDWLPIGGGTGTFAVTASSTGTFSGLAGTTGTSKDLDVSTQPVGLPFSLPNFLLLPSGITIELTMIDFGVFGSADCAAAPAPGQNCTPLFPPPKSPFNLTNTAVGATASFTIHGVATSADVSVPPSNVLGIYTTQFVGRSYQTMLSTIARGGKVRASYSANLIAEQQIPEPSTMYLGLGGFAMAVAGVLRRRLFHGRPRHSAL